MSNVAKSLSTLRAEEPSLTVVESWTAQNLSLAAARQDQPEVTRLRAEMSAILTAKGWDEMRVEWFCAYLEAC